MKAGDFDSVTSTAAFDDAVVKAARLANARERAEAYAANLCEECKTRPRHRRGRHTDRLCDYCFGIKQKQRSAEREREERAELTRQFDEEVSLTKTVRGMRRQIDELERRLKELEAK